ncbi:MAG: hypothetical protein AABW93_03585 [Nanoarchaeota archaeon]
MMNKNGRPAMQEGRSLDIYDARLIFRITRREEKLVKIVRVKIRYSKKGHYGKQEFSFPEKIEDDDLCWDTYRGEKISVYHRIEANKYKDIRHSIAPTSLGQKLEALVSETDKRLRERATERLKRTSKEPTEKAHEKD